MAEGPRKDRHYRWGTRLREGEESKWIRSLSLDRGHALHVPQRESRDRFLALLLAFLLARLDARHVQLPPFAQWGQRLAEGIPERRQRVFDARRHLVVILPRHDAVRFHLFQVLNQHL